MTRLLRREKEAAAQVLSLMTVFISLSVTISFSLISAIQAIDAQPESISVQNTIITAPLTILVPITADVQNAQICVTILSSGSQSCQQVVLNPETGSYTPVTVDLSQPTPTITPEETIQTASSPTPNQPQSINVEHTVVTAPITVMVPITGGVQNAQICVSTASSGDQSCTQVVVDPEENSYDPVNVDLSSEIPTLTAAEQEPTDTTTAAATTTEPITTITTTTTEEQPTAPTTPAPTTTTTEPTPAPTEEPTTDTGTQEGGTTTEEPAPDSGTQEPTTEGSTSEGGSQ